MKRVNNDDSINFCPYCGSENIEYQEGHDLHYCCYDCESWFSVTPDGILDDEQKED